MRLKIGDTSWKVRLLTPEKFISTHGPDYTDAAALTDTTAKIIDFRTDEITLENCRHELFHTYFTLTLTHNSDNMSKDDVEELGATLIGKYGEDLIKNSKKVYRWLKKEAGKP